MTEQIQENSEPLNKVSQLTILGKGECGKSSIISRFKTNEFGNGARATPIESTEHSFNKKSLEFQLKIWDTCGQEDFARFRTLTLPISDYVIVCYSVVDPLSFYQVEDTLIPMIKEKAKETAKVLLVATKIDLRDLESITTEEGQSLAKKLDVFKFIECSALENTNIQNIFSAIEEDIYEKIKPKRSSFFSWFPWACCE